MKTNQNKKSFSAYGSSWKLEKSFVNKGINHKVFLYFHNEKIKRLIVEIPKSLYEREV